MVDEDGERFVRALRVSAWLMAAVAVPCALVMLGLLAWMVALAFGVTP
jgi:hypothetical protein